MFSRVWAAGFTFAYALIHKASPGASGHTGSEEATNDQTNTNVGFQETNFISRAKPINQLCM